MGNLKRFIVLILCCRIAVSDLINGYRVLCYHPICGTIYPKQEERHMFHVNDINVTYCSHLVSKYSSNVPIELLVKPETEAHDFFRLTRIREINSGLKLIIAFGGYNFSENDGTKMYRDVSFSRNGRDRRNFIENVLKFLRKFQFDGISLDWQGPDSNGSEDERRNEIENYVFLLREFKEKFKGKPYELFVALNTAFYREPSFNLKEIEGIADFISLMAYNYTGPWNDNKQIGHHSCLRQKADDRIHTGINSVDSDFKYLLDDTKLDSKKLLLGLPFFGQSYYLTDKQNYQPGDLFIEPNPGRGHVSSLRDGLRSYQDICRNLSDQNVGSNSPIVIYDHKNCGAPYLVQDIIWTAYDDEQSIRFKINYMKLKNLSGVSIFNINFDDFLGECNRDLRFPLLKSVYEQLIRN